MNDAQFRELKWVLYMIVFGQLGIVLTLVIVALIVRARDLDRIYDAIGRQTSNISTITIERPTTFDDHVKSILKGEK